MLNRLLALVWAGAAIAIGYMAFSIAIGPKGDASGWVLAAVFGAVAVFGAWQAWKEWNTVEPRPVPMPAPMQTQQRKPEPSADAPGAWRGPSIALETQIAELRKAGLVLAPGRTIDELLMSWPRAEYESDPYGLILVMYGSEVEAEPWGRAFCERGWNFDMECLAEAGDYVAAFTSVLRATSQPSIVTNLSDTFDIDAETCEIRYTIKSRDVVVTAKVDNDWADPEAVAAFLRDIESAIGDGRHFWAADNGQASVLFFVTDAEAAKVNALREDVLVRYTAD